MLSTEISNTLPLQELPGSVLSAFNNEAIKLAAMGVTIVAASGDDGVASVDCACSADSGSAASTSASGGGWTGDGWSGQGYVPSFPATSPWVRTTRVLSVILQ
jgi:subtilase family serine protease